MIDMFHTITTSYDKITGNEREQCYEYLGIRYALASRFEYPAVLYRPVSSDATKYGPTCPQTRQFYEHLEIPERMFYHREFRDGIEYEYDEDCLNLNIYTPKELSSRTDVGKTRCPVIIFFYGGGFNSGSTQDSSFDGEAYAKRGAILVMASYRVGILGYLTHESIEKNYRHDGNFGLYDQFTAIKWVKNNIADFGGDPDNITIMGQSAGAISVQYLCLSEQCKGLFKHAIMLSGGGMFPKFALPRKAEDTREYWLDLMKTAGCKTFEELKELPLDKMFAAIEDIKSRRKDNTYNTMPVVDGMLIEKPITELIRNPLKIDYMITYTNNDMYAPIMAHIGNRFAAANGGYTAFFDIDAPGDNNAAFHSSDLRYVFGTLDKSHRPYTDRDREISDLMIDYIVSFARTGDPNGEDRPVWTPRGNKSLCIGAKTVKMGKPNIFKMTKNMLTKGDPK